MGQKYKIFLRRHQFVFDENINAVPNAHVIIKTLNKTLVKKIVRYLRKEEKPQIIVVSQPNGFDVFCDYFRLIEAGGGAVFNTNDQLLLIRRNDLWDLPKGKLEKGESFEIGALREVEEECSVTGLEIIRPLTKTYHLYKDKKWMLKRTDWFVMSARHWEDAKPQLEENIEAIKWVDSKELNLEELDTYSSIKDVLKRL